MTNDHFPDGSYQNRRERHTALAEHRRTTRSRPRVRNRPAASPPKKFSVKATAASLAITLLLTSYLVPTFAGSTPSAIVDQAAADPQSLSVSADIIPSAAATRDHFIVAKTTLAGYQPYEHLADTFANNPNSSVQWPFDVGVPISSWFGYRSCAGCTSDHQGIDLNPGEGTPIQAIADGVVTEVGNPNGSFGVYAIISHQIDGQNVSSLYAHMLLGSLALAVGDTISQGQLVGQVGSTGQSTGPHLHFGIYLDGITAIDPYPWMKEKVGS